MLFQGGLRFGGGRSLAATAIAARAARGIAIIIAVALIAVAWLLSVVIRFALSRKREFLADAGSVELTKNPDAMISALRKIEGRGELQGATSAVMEMCIDNPREGFADLFATHPSVESRVEALVQFAGGHDPGPLALPEAAGRCRTDAEQDPADGMPPALRRPRSGAAEPPNAPAKPVPAERAAASRSAVANPPGRPLGHPARLNAARRSAAEVTPSRRGRTVEMSHRCAGSANMNCIRRSAMFAVRGWGCRRSDSGAQGGSWQSRQ